LKSGGGSIFWPTVVFFMYGFLVLGFFLVMHMLYFRFPGEEIELKFDFGYGVGWGKRK
jgi:hypothetical protein